MKHPHDNDDVTIPSPEPTDDLHEAGIRVGDKGFYDPERGAKKEKTPKPEYVPGPLLATDPGQPEQVEAKGIKRENASALDKSEAPVVQSKEEAKPRVTGRRAATAKE